jgi:hypothetical protein
LLGMPTLQSRFGCDCMKFIASGVRSQWRAFRIAAN